MVPIPYFRSASQVCLYSDYRFNPSLSPDIFNEVRIAVLPTVDNGDTAIWGQRQRRPLTDVERLNSKKTGQYCRPSDGSVCNFELADEDTDIFGEIALDHGL